MGPSNALVWKQPLEVNERHIRVRLKPAAIISNSKQPHTALIHAREGLRIALAVIMLHIVGGDCQQLVAWCKDSGVWPCTLRQAVALQHLDCVEV